MTNEEMFSQDIAIHTATGHLAWYRAKREVDRLHEAQKRVTEFHRSGTDSQEGMVRYWLQVRKLFFEAGGKYRVHVDSELREAHVGLSAIYEDARDSGPYIAAGQIPKFKRLLEILEEALPKEL